MDDQFTVDVPHIFRVFFCLLVAAFILMMPIKVFADQNLGIWVEAEGKNQPFRSTEETLKYLEFIANNEFKEIYLQVYREGRSWFPSKLADQRPYENSLENGFDPLKLTLEVAHSKGIKVFAWINVLRVDKNAPLLKTIGKEIVLEDNLQNSVLDYDSLGRPPRRSINEDTHFSHIDTPGVWLDPSSEKLQQYLTVLVQEIIGRYPELDGIHLDMIRFPFFEGSSVLSFPYGTLAKEKFFNEYKKYPPADNRCKRENLCASKEEWNAWRREKIADVVKVIRSTLKMYPKNYELSTAVIANQERSYSHAMQNWKAWLREALVDKVVIMNYAKDRSIYEMNIRKAIKDVPSNQLAVGIGAWLLLDSPLAYTEQLRLAEVFNTYGPVLFSYSNLLNSKGALLLKSDLAQCRVR